MKNENQTRVGTGYLPGEGSLKDRTKAHVWFRRRSKMRCCSTNPLEGRSG